MVRLSNNLVGLLNLITLLLSVPIIGGGIWLSKQDNTECVRFLDTPIIVLGVFVLVVSLAGLIGSCCRVSWLLWLYLFVMFLLIVLLFCFTIFAFVVTNKGAGRAISGRGYKEYRLGDYSNWLQNRVNKQWNRISRCLMESNICHRMLEDQSNRISSCLMESNICHRMLEDQSTAAQEFYQRHLSSLQSGCCKPLDECGFDYVSPTNWTQVQTSNLDANPDCRLWNNDPNTLCYRCQSCKAGLLDNIKSDWKRVAVINIIFLIFLIIVYSIGCCAFRNNRQDNAWKP